MTILGDLAQATVPGGQRDWARAIAVLDAPVSTYDELTVGYRVPAPILDVANRLLPVVAPGLRPTTSARARGDAPRFRSVSGPELADAIVAEASDLRSEWESTAVVVPPSLYDASAQALTEAGLDFTDGRQTLALGDHLTLLTATMTKGLEFDAVLVLEPARIVAEHPNGLRLLYVVLTRAVQALSVLSSEPLPPELAGDVRR
jgi:DNA helicase IV